MVEVTLASMGNQVEEATVQVWFFEEGDTINEGDDLVELSVESGVFTLQAPASGILAEVYYDEGESVQNEDLLCLIDNEVA